MQVKIVHKSGAKPAGSSGNKQAMMFRRLVEHLQAMSEEKFTGYIKIKYSQGSIGRVERFEEILKR